MNNVALLFRLLHDCSFVVFDPGGKILLGISVREIAYVEILKSKLDMKCKSFSNGK